MKEKSCDDPFNLKGTRNQVNTNRQFYNCGGLALKTYNWVCPYVRTDGGFNVWDKDTINSETYTDNNRLDYIRFLYQQGHNKEEIEDIILNLDTEFMLKHIQNLKEVDINTCDINDRVIAYRIFTSWDEEFEALDDDFHFRVRIGGFWFEKCGAENTTICTDFDVWGNPDDDDLVYTSDIKYFKIQE